MEARAGVGPVGRHRQQRCCAARRGRRAGGDTDEPWDVFDSAICVRQNGSWEQQGHGGEHANIAQLNIIRHSSARFFMCAPFKRCVAFAFGLWIAELEQEVPPPGTSDGKARTSNIYYRGSRRCCCKRT